MGELNWIFTAITDTIAWNVLPRGEAAAPAWAGRAAGQEQDTLPGDIGGVRWSRGSPQ